MFSRDFLKRLLVFDVEAVVLTENYKDLPNDLDKEWELRCQRMPNLQEKFKSHLPYRDGHSNEVLQRAYQRVYEEEGGKLIDFCKIVCLSIGVIREDETENLFTKVKTLQGTEKEILTEFNSLLDKNKYVLGGMNIMFYDVPIVSRRSLINGIKPAKRFMSLGGEKPAKPWELSELFNDLTDTWCFGSYGQKFSTFNMICASLNVPTPKDKMDGSEVHNYYYKHSDLESIQHYCEKDVNATMQCYINIHKICQ